MPSTKSVPRLTPATLHTFQSALDVPDGFHPVSASNSFWVALSVLHDQLTFPIHGQHNRHFRLLHLAHQLCGVTLECAEAMNIAGKFHGHCSVAKSALNLTIPSLFD